MSGAVWRFGSAHVEAEVQSLAGMLGPASFRVGGRTVQPFAVAPWGEDVGPQYEGLPPILQRLRGEWPCVPFGADADRPALPADWQPGAGGEAAVADPGPHGYSSNHHWSLQEQGRDWVRLGISYPEDHAVERLVRTVRAAPDEAKLLFSLEIHPRRDCLLPIGLHPTYVLPAEPGALRLDFGPEARAWTFPTEVEAGRTALQPDQRGVAPDSVAKRGGVRIDIRTLPVAPESEDLVLLTGLGGRIDLSYVEAGYRVEQRWNGQHLPSCMLWMSAGGRQFYPWSGRFRGLGVEPVSAPFDLGPATAVDANNPLAATGTATGVRLKAGQPLLTEYSIAVRAE